MNPFVLQSGWALAAATMITLAPGLPANAEGINLSWDDCGTHGQAVKSFACDTNVGPAFLLVGSYVAPGGSTAITGMEAALDISSSYSPIPDWWKFKNAGSCRQTALVASADFLGTVLDRCSDYWAGQAAGGISAYITPHATLDCRARLTLIFAVAPSFAAPVEADLEYYAFRLAISRAKTVGTGSCAHCAAPALLTLNETKLSQPVGVGNYRLQLPASRNYVDWQASHSVCGRVPTRNSTWGAIKAQYR